MGTSCLIHNACSGQEKSGNFGEISKAKALVRKIIEGEMNVDWKK